MQKSARDVFNHICSTDHEPDLIKALEDMDKLSVEDCRAVADALENDLSAPNWEFSPDDVSYAKHLISSPKDDTDRWEEVETMKSEIRGMMAIFNKIAEVKGDSANDLTKHMTAGYAELSERQKDNLVALAEVSYIASERSCRVRPKT